MSKLIWIILLVSSILLTKCFRFPRSPVFGLPIMINDRTRLHDSNIQVSGNSPKEEDFKKYINYIQNTVTELEEIKKMKTNLLRLCATCDRGFAATKEDNANIADIISSLKFLAPDNNPTRGLSPNQESTGGDVPIEGIWKLAYTTAFDVLSLNGNPLYQLQGIYQAIRADGSSANVIDLAPRIQTLLPVSISSRFMSSTRAIVGTSSYARNNTRVGLTFKSVQLKPVSLLGIELKDFPIAVPSLKIDLPRFGLNSEQSTDSSGYFDVEYLDEDCLIISQNQPGGVFVSFRDYTQSFDEILN